MKMMEKLLVLLLALCLLTPAALAEIDEDGDLAVSLPGVSFFFTPPEDAFVLGREMSASVYNALGLSQREMESVSVTKAQSRSNSTHLHRPSPFPLR